MPSHDFVTTASLVLLTLLSLWVWALELRQLRRSEAAPADNTAWWLLALCGLASATLFAYRAVVVHRGWQPLQAHVDGLLLIAALFAGTVLFLQVRARLPGLGVFAVPLLTLMLAWAVCASWWTLRPFDLGLTHISTLWRGLHLISVYLGTLFLAIAAIAGGMFLYVEHRLRQKRDLRGLGRLASLEAAEALIVRTSAVGFALLTLGLVTGLIITVSDREQVAALWAYRLKIALSLAAWVIYALVMNVRHATHFRGRRAAWLSIAGMVLLLATFGVVNAMRVPAAATPASQSANELGGAAEGTSGGGSGAGTGVAR